MEKTVQEKGHMAQIAAGKKKGNHKNLRMNDVGDGDDHRDFETKKSKSTAKKVVNPFGLLGDDVSQDDEEDASGVFTGLSVADFKEDTLAIKFSGKKKPSKKKNSDTIIGAVYEHEHPTTCNFSKETDVSETFKNKKKKKKGRRIAHEEDDDIDKILTEHAGSEVAQRSAEPTIIVDEGGEKDGFEDTAESAAAKKKKKKKEKEKEKKAAREKTTATPFVEEKPVKSKKVPKHVKEIQEKLAEFKKAEEKKKREEEEKLKKEEEERLKQEERDRMAEEEKRLKKEREKEKKLKKKQEGKPLTEKQKAEARHLELKRNQFLANAAGGLPLPARETSSGPTKPPKYITKKPKPRQNANSKDSASNQEDSVPKLGDLDVKNVEENIVALEIEDDGNKEDDEWDAKNWDDEDLKFPGVNPFDDEDEVTELEPNNLGVNQNLDKKESQPARVVNKAKQHVKHKQIEKEEVGEKTLRSPICCIMGHVDAGKTKLLDCIRKTNVQKGEAGGITQQIGATYIPADNIRERTKELKPDAKLDVPGLLVIDTPGHESFKNLRSRGSGLCDIAVLVVSIMKGLEPQTIESLNLLRMRNTDFIVALNKVDTIYGWKNYPNVPIRDAMKRQSKDVQAQFKYRLTQIITQFKEQGLNTEIYSKNKDRGETYSIVPTSAISGEGIPEMLLQLVQWAQKTMVEKLTYCSEIQCTVLEVKVTEGLGTTIDVILVNGVLHEKDEIVVCGSQGPIHTKIQSLLTPCPMKELRVKGTYVHHKEIKAAQAVKITAQNLENAVAGTSLYVVRPDDAVQDIKKSVMDDMDNVMSRIDKSGEGIYIQASSLGSLEALLDFLKTPNVNIPVSGIGIGPVHKKDVMKASVMLEKRQEFAAILAFDVEVIPEARVHADGNGVKIFVGDVIYRLIDQFKAHIEIFKAEKKKKAAKEAVFPCRLQIMPDHVFRKKDPIILGVDVLKGILKIGTPICIPQRDFIDIGHISFIKKNDKPVKSAKKGEEVSIEIKGNNAEDKQKEFGRHFEVEDKLVSRISRKSIAALEEHYKDQMSGELWRLVDELKKCFKIL